MGKPTGFKEYDRSLPGTRPPEERLKDYNEFYVDNGEKHSKEQAARCMDCGVPFCHNGCPLGNNIPEFNDAAYRGDWEYAIHILQTTNNFPEFTGRICPAPCESSCVLGINKPPVAIEYIEKSIAEKAFELGYITPEPPKHRTGKKVAVIGSGPAGLAAAAQLNKAGHTVTVFERASRIGGLLRYGIPDFKMEKWVIDRRLAILEEEGVIFKTGVNVGKDITGKDLQEQFDAICLAGGSTTPRDIPIPGRDLKNIHFAMDFLSQQNDRNAGSKGHDIRDHKGFNIEEEILATDKNVVVIGGGDTGSDCIGTSNRHGAASITQLEITPVPPMQRSPENPWPEWPMVLRTSSSHEEGAERKWSIMTKEFIGDGKGNVKALKVANVEMKDGPNGQKIFKEIEGSEKEVPCDLALIAVGFIHPEKEGILSQLDVETDGRGNVKANNYKTNIENVFVAGDMRRGQSLVVWAISEGREAARAIDKQLMGASTLEAKDESLFSLAD